VRVMLALCLLLAVLACGGDPAQKQGGGGSGGDAGGSGGSGGAPGKLDCVGVFLCAEKCKDRACITACQDTARAGAWDAAYALAKCGVDHGCQDASCPECSAERDACVHDGLQELSCSALANCIDFCAGNETCVTDLCLHQAEPGAEAAYQQYEACLAQFGCTGDDRTCIDLNCGTESDACFGG
jgi:hypothetical protein